MNAQIRRGISGTSLESYVLMIALRLRALLLNLSFLFLASISSSGVLLLQRNGSAFCASPDSFKYLKQFAQVENFGVRFALVKCVLCIDIFGDAKAGKMKLRQKAKENDDNSIKGFLP